MSAHNESRIRQQRANGFIVGTKLAGLPQEGFDKPSFLKPAKQATEMNRARRVVGPAARKRLGIRPLAEWMEP